MGETGRFSTLAVQLADVLYLLGRDDEALGLTEESERATAPEDLVSQCDWRRARAKIIARRGEHGRAEVLVFEAFRLSEQSPDDVQIRVKVLRDVAEVLRVAGRPDEGIPYLQRALELEERKGNVTGAGMVRASLDRLTAEAG
jgi:hypothetical protein